MIPKIADLIRQGRRFLVASHESPDGDAIGSTLAMSHALRALGKEVTTFNQDPVPKNFRFLPGSESIVDRLPEQARFDVGFILDAGELRRAGNHLSRHCELLVNIDHHPYSEHLGPCDLLDIEASATGALVYRVLTELQVTLTEEMAVCIYTAVLSDTGSFRYSNANPEAFHIAAEMVGLGIDPWYVASGLYESQDAARLRLLAKALATLTLSRCGRMASVTVTDGMMEEAGATVEHTDGFVNYPRSVRGVEVALFFRQVSADSYKVGFRSKGTIDVGALARELGGGGHHNAAGAMVEGDIESIRREVFARLELLLP